MCTDIDDAESMYNPNGEKLFVASYYYGKNRCENCKGKGYTGKSGPYTLIQCKKCDGTGKND